ncbi:hypothetical protein A0H76_2714 [Hepatospora eriocheir]|uniref:Fork-head domain-containing protein n=1 Tax=Hepatospora eriocheir TaxID=1081669 RepID=A0A1X0QEU6_9MICR|nr:hypothetical protein HERIO_1157 [Hepatospora eriocheir]ORD98328.1 hypothetical protein A0H76_2714 [Hepatospora eriocheir]
MYHKIKKDFTYLSIIKEAISTFPRKAATTRQIFSYMVAKHPNIFKESNSLTWKNNVRQLLSKSPEFIKHRGASTVGTKHALWIFKPIEEIEKEEDMLRNYLQFDDTNSSKTNTKYFYDFYCNESYENEENK